VPTLGRRRALGQHFLKDKAAAQTIADAALALAREHGCKSLLEIGPGHGAITDPLLHGYSSGGGGASLILCERDRNLAANWKTRATGAQVEDADFLELPEDRWLSKPPLAVVSNLPYSAGTAILTRLARHPGKIAGMVLMFQAEVARRLRAEPGTKEWGSLSIWLQNRWDVRRLLHVPPRAFSPPPEVESEVVTLLARKEPRIALPDEPAFERLLKQAFAHRRKMLRSSLSGRAREALTASSLDGTLRAEQLSWADWEKFYAAYMNQTGQPSA
jgi:16S rRNA (adenine1518-N6/adenine1519-N6)-dimethyltransferase